MKTNHWFVVRQNVATGLDEYLIKGENSHTWGEFSHATEFSRKTAERQAFSGAGIFGVGVPAQILQLNHL